MPFPALTAFPGFSAGRRLARKLARHLKGVMCLGRRGRERFVDGITPAFAARPA